MFIFCTSIFIILGGLIIVTATSFEHDICFCNSEIRSAAVHRFQFIHEYGSFSWLEACINRLPSHGRGPCMDWPHLQGEHCKDFPNGTGICYGHKQLNTEGHAITFNQFKGTLPKQHRTKILMECEDVCREEFGPGRDRCEGPECPMDHTWHDLTSMCNYTDSDDMVKALPGDKACKMTLWENVKIPGIDQWKGPDPSEWVGYGPSLGPFAGDFYPFPFGGPNYKTTI